MPARVTTTDFPLGALFRRLAGNLMIVFVLVTTAIVLTQFDAATPRPSAAREFTDPPSSGLIVRSEIIRLWVPETLVDPAGHESRAPVARTHPELKTVLEHRRQENLWYAITFRAQLADHRTEESSFIRYPYRQPESFAEFMDVLTAVAGSPPRHPCTDYSAAVVHIMPAGLSQREFEPNTVERRATREKTKPNACEGSVSPRQKSGKDMQSNGDWRLVVDDGQRF
jgi:hypothetical protein